MFKKQLVAFSFASTLIPTLSGPLNYKALLLAALALWQFQNHAHANLQQYSQPVYPPDLVQKSKEKETTERFQQWQGLIDSASLLSDHEKLVAVNNFFNKMKWVEDKQLWGEEDYWATPIESLLKNAGDCEDFSIAKYFTLRKMGVAEEQLKISYVVLRKQQQPHMVLSYYPEGKSDPLVLDNIRPSILKSSERDDLKPVFHMNRIGFWHQSKPNEMLGSANTVSKWRTMMVRLWTDQVLVSSDIMLAQIFRDLEGLPVLEDAVM